MDDKAQEQLEFAYDAWLASAQAAADEIDAHNKRLPGNSRYTWLRPVSPQVQAGKLMADMSRNWNGDYDQQMIVNDHEHSSFYNDANVLDLIRADSRQVWTREG